MFSQRPSSKHWVLAGFCAAAVVALLDQLSKFLWSGPVSVNSGISFSRYILPEPWQSMALIGFFVVLVMFSVWMMSRERSWRVSLGYGMLLGGGFANLFDRWWFDGVRDIWQIPGTDLVNNLADWAIFLAVLFLLSHEILSLVKKHL